MRGVVVTFSLLVALVGGGRAASAATATFEVAAPELVRWGSARTVEAGDFRLSVSGAVDLQAAQGGVRLTNLRPAPGGVRQNQVVGRLALAGGGVVDAGFADLAVLGWVDLVDERGQRIARDRAAAIVVSGGRAIAVVPGISWDGRAEPVPGSAHHYLVMSWDDVALGEPSRAPGTLVERRDGKERPVGGALEVELTDGGDGDGRRVSDRTVDRAVDRAVDRIDRLTLQVTRADGTTLRLAGVRLDVARGGIVVDGAAPHLGWVRLAVWGRCDVIDGAGRTVAEQAPLRVWVGKDGVAHVDVDGVMSLVIRQ